MSAPKPYALSFNLETDFDGNLRLKDGAMGEKKEISLDDLHKAWCMDAATKEDLVRYALQWKERYLQLERELNDLKSQPLCRIGGN
jgi:hypothetical protein